MIHQTKCYSELERLFLCNNVDFSADSCSSVGCCSWPPRRLLIVLRTNDPIFESLGIAPKRTNRRKRSPGDFGLDERGFLGGIEGNGLESVANVMDVAGRKSLKDRTCVAVDSSACFRLGLPAHLVVRDNVSISN